MNETQFQMTPESPLNGEAGFDLLLRQLRSGLGLDMKQYKPNYLRRRLGVRMRATGCTDYLQYRQYIKKHPDECQRLINDLTINVTEFFRDEDVYQAIRENLIPEIVDFKKKSGIHNIRVWSAGCATGEEPYSLSALFLHVLRDEGGAAQWALRITATDLDDKALEKAREGVYEQVKLLPGMAAEDFFVEKEHRFEVREEVRRPIRFMIMDIMKHPPLRHLDLILCRNVLIYFEKGKQEKVLGIFNKCLRKGGFLVLGKSEAILGTGESGFLPHIRRERVYVKAGEAAAGSQPGVGKREGCERS